MEEIKSKWTIINFRFTLAKKYEDIIKYNKYDAIYIYSHWLLLFSTNLIWNVVAKFIIKIHKVLWKIIECNGIIIPFQL